MKRVIRIFLIVFVSIFVLLPVVLLCLLQSEYIQRKLTDFAFEKLEEMTGGGFEVGSIKLSGFDELELEELLVRDLQQDTLLYVEFVSADLEFWSIFSDEIRISGAFAEGVDLQLRKNQASGLVNIKELVDKVVDPKKPREKLPIGLLFEEIEVSNGRVRFQDSSKVFDRDFGMNYADLDLREINAVVKNLELLDIDEGLVAMEVKELAVKEKSGMKVDKLNCRFVVGEGILDFENVDLTTPHSQLFVEKFKMSAEDFELFGEDFIQNVWLSANLERADLDLGELRFYVPIFERFDGEKVNVSGKLQGYVSNLMLDSIELDYDKTQIRGDFSIKGLPDVYSTYIFADVKNLRTFTTDVERLVGKIQGKKRHLPAEFHRFGEITFNGNFTGFIDDFVTYGKFNTNLGRIATDLMIAPTSEFGDTVFRFNGNLKTERFELGKMLGNKVFGAISMNSDVSGGTTSQLRLHGKIDGKVSSLVMKDYNYRDIIINGRIDGKRYEGDIFIDEENVSLTCQGSVDLNEAIPHYDIKGECKKANLYKLKFIESDTTAFTSFQIDGQFLGSNIDDLDGELNLHEAVIELDGRRLELGEVSLFSKRIQDSLSLDNSFIFRSDVVTAEIKGRYQFLKLGESVVSMMKNYAPAWGADETAATELSKNNFRFHFEIRDAKRFSEFLSDKFYIGRIAAAPSKPEINGVYNPSEKQFSMHVNMPYIRYDGKHFIGLHFNADTENNALIFDLGCQKIRLSDNFSFDNLTIYAEAQQDSADLNIRWNNWAVDSLLHQANIKSKVLFLRRTGKIVPMLHLFTEPTTITIANEKWHLSHKGISLNGDKINIHKLLFAQDQKHLSLDGLISPESTDKLNLAAAQIPLSLINSMFQMDKLLFGGIATGTATLSDIYNRPLFVADMDVEDLMLNSASFGDTKISAQWDDISRKILVNAASKTESLKFDGNYNTVENTIDFDVITGRVPANILSPYISGIFSEMNGELSAKLKLSGPVDAPIIDGRVLTHGASLVLDFTKVKYNLEGVVPIQKGIIRLDSLRIFDRFRSQAIPKGRISIADFKNINYNLQFQMQNLEVLATKLSDSPDFYGSAYASGVAVISGNAAELNLGIGAKVGNKTNFCIPVSASEKLSRSSFLTFIEHSAPKQRQRKVISFAPQRQQTPEESAPQELKYSVKMKLEITPEAEAQLIFDPQIGDIITARGDGNLDLLITNSKFDMTGVYTLRSGNYLFTLRQFALNKKFQIKEGSVISWNGDPLGALLNLKATYTAKPSMSDLMSDASSASRRRLPVDCILDITGLMSNPKIQFDLQMPEATQEMRAFLAAATSSEEEKTRQFLALLATNSFFPSQNSSSAMQTASSISNMGLATATEFLATQLSNMTSQLTDKFDVDFSYRPSTELSNQNIGLDLSTDLFRIHFDYDIEGKNAVTSTGNQVGDASIDFKLGKSDRLRFKMFYRANDHYFDNSASTQGIGLMYRREFNLWSELFSRKKKQEKKEEK